MSEFERAFAFQDRIEERTAERLEPTPYGPVVMHSRLNRVHDLNFLRAEKPGGATAEELAAEAERVQGAAESATAASTSERRAAGAPGAAVHPPRMGAAALRADGPAARARPACRARGARGRRADAAPALGRGDPLRAARPGRKRSSSRSSSTAATSAGRSRRGSSPPRRTASSLHTRSSIPRTASPGRETSTRWPSTAGEAWRARSCYVASPIRTRPATTSPSWSRTRMTGRRGCTRGSASRLWGGTRGSSGPARRNDDGAPWAPFRRFPPPLKALCLVDHDRAAENRPPDWRVHVGAGDAHSRCRNDVAAISPRDPDPELVHAAAAGGIAVVRGQR